MSTLQNNTVITSIGFAKDKMFIELSTSRVLTVPYNYTKKLQNASIEELKSRIKFHGRRFIEHNGYGFTTKAWEDA